jgi:hypothetical protein
VHEVVVCNRQALESCHRKAEAAAEEALTAALGLVKSDLLGTGDQVCV